MALISFDKCVSLQSGKDDSHVIRKLQLLSWVVEGNSTITTKTWIIYTVQAAPYTCYSFYLYRGRDVMHNPSTPSSPAVAYAARIMTVLKGPVRVHSLSVGHKWLFTAYTSHLQTVQRYIHICFTPFPIIPLRYISCLYYLLDPRYRWILLRNSRMLLRALLYESNPWTLTNGILSSVTTKHGKTILLTIREDDCTVVKMFLPKRYGDTFSYTDIVTINNRSVQYHVIYKEGAVGPIPTFYIWNDTMRRDVGLFTWCGR